VIYRPLTTVLAAAALLLASAAAEAAPPRRIVSLNLCTDEILLDLVPRDRIAAVSHLAADPLVSAVAVRAEGLTWTYGEAEKVLALEPDLVLAGMFTTPATLDLLERIGQRVVRVPTASDIDGIRSAIRTVAAAVDEQARGEDLIKDFDARLAAASADAAPPAATPVGDASPLTRARGENGPSEAPKNAMRAGRPSAMVYQVNGLSAGSGSLADTLITAAGLDNHAARVGLGSGGALPLEMLAAHPPDLIILSGPADEYRTVVAENLRHPALAAVLRDHASVLVPWRLWLCGTHHAAEAVERLAEARRLLARQERVR
jgi:iron complex transport system substrate-binding protein